MSLVITTRSWGAIQYNLLVGGVYIYKYKLSQKDTIDKAAMEAKELGEETSIATVQDVKT